MSVEFSSEPDRRVAESVVGLAALLMRRPTSGLSLTASGMLSLLTRLGPLRVTDLAGRLHVSQPSMTELVIRLERTGLVARRRDRDDARAVLVEMTEEGGRLRDRVRAERADYLAGLISRLDETERAALRAAGPAVEHLIGVATESLAGEPTHSGDMEVALHG